MLDSYRELIDELLGTPSLARAAVRAGGEPAARLVAAMHTRDGLVLERVQRIKSQTDPHLRTLPTLAALEAGATAPDDTDALLARFETVRGDLVSLLMNLTLRDWERTATTDDGDVITLADEIEAHVEVDEAQRERLEAFAG